MCGCASFRQLPGAQILNEDGSNRDFLLSEGLESAESFVALTNIDEENNEDGAASAARARSWPAAARCPVRSNRDFLLSWSLWL